MLNTPRRINLENAVNLRELGGYMRQDGKITNYGRFLRSGNPALLSSNEIQYLKDYGLKTVIDLRTESEIKKEPSALCDVDGINYFHIPMFESFMQDENVPKIPDEEFNLGKFYEIIFNYSTSFGNIFNTMAESGEGTILYNCTAGKDRTGLTSVLLLMLAGVDEMDIVADYQVSFTYFKKAFMRELELNPHMPMHFAHSNPEWIENFIRLVISNYGNAEGYLVYKGVSPSNLEILKSRLV